MLAGYLPFDDDPANPEGDNINLLYKYIVSTPLTFPEYVTPHARDLLRRILVPDPRKRADLFEVARHSWLSEYAHVVGFITSTTTTPAEIAHTSITSERADGAPLLARSASVREPTKTQKPVPVVGDLARKHGNVDDADEMPKANKDAKRRTLQVEYVAPRQQTTRGEDVKPQSSSRARADSQGQIDLDVANVERRPTGARPLPEPRKDSRAQRTESRDKASMPPPSRPGREPPRSVSDNAFMAPLLTNSMARPNTGGSMVSNASARQYSQTAAPTLQTTTAHGRMTQPTNGKRYENASGESEMDTEYGRPSVNVPSKFARISGIDGTGPTPPPIQQEHVGKRTHKRSSTISSMTEKLFGRQSGIFGSSKPAVEKEKGGKKYPPVSYNNAAIAGHDSGSRPSIDSRRSISFGFGKKRSGSVTGGSTGGDSGREKPTRRFSLLPSGFSLKAIGIGKDYESPAPTPPPRDEQSYYDERYYAQEPVEANRRPQTTGQMGYDSARSSPQQQQQQRDPRQQRSGRYDGGGSSYEQPGQGYTRPSTTGTPPMQQQQQGYAGSGLSKSATQPIITQAQGRRGQAQYAPQTQTQYEYDDRLPLQGSTTMGNMRAAGPGAANGAGARGMLQKGNRRFVDAYEGENGGQAQGQSGGSSGAARKVMDFFRRRGRERGGE